MSESSSEAPKSAEGSSVVTDRQLYAQARNPERDVNNDLGERFRQLSQADRLNDPRLENAAKVLAVVEAKINTAYDVGSKENRQARQHAVEIIARNLEQGQKFDVPLVRETQPVERLAREDRALDRDQEQSR